MLAGGHGHASLSSELLTVLGPCRDNIIEVILAGNESRRLVGADRACGLGGYAIKDNLGLRRGHAHLHSGSRGRAGRCFLRRSAGAAGAYGVHAGNDCRIAVVVGIKVGIVIRVER